MTSGQNIEPFLKAILPQQGLKCAAVLEGTFFKHTFFETNADLAKFIYLKDAAGFTVYHACAGYSTSKNRKGENVQAVRSLWMDIDAGEGKPYADAGEAYKAVRAFIEAVGLPFPIVVSSGHGIHCYWPFKEDLTPQDWKQYAAGLKTAAQVHNLAIDPSRATDVASILRPAGSHNRKGGKEIEVRVGPLVGPYDILDFKKLVDNSRPVFVAQLGSAKRSLLAGATNVVMSQPSDPVLVANACAQMREFRDTRGNISEPNWYAGIGVMAFCEGGDEWAQQHSSGHPQYSPDETQKRLERARSIGGPTTCAHFASINPEACASCPLLNRITSPVQAGRPNAPRAEAPQPEHKLFAGDKKLEVGAVELPMLDPPFRWGANGELLFVSEDARGKPVTAMVTRYPIFLAAQLASEATQEDYSYVWRYKAPTEAWREINVPASMLYGAQSAAALASKGVNIHDNSLFRQYMTQQVDAIARDRGKQVRYDQFGWKGDTFVYGSRVYGKGEVGNVFLSDRPAKRAPLLVPAGNLSAWRDAANMLFAKDVESQAFAMLASFAAPLMKFHGENEGGAVLSLVTSGSGKGKSTSLYGACSVWGRYAGLEINRTDTEISKAIILGMLANLPVIFDELPTRDPDAARRFIEMFTNGRDKNRATQEGNLKDNVSRWATILMCASNVSVVDTVTTSNVDAAGFRILELPVVNSSYLSHSRGDQIRKTFEYNYGHAGDIFLRYLTRPDTLNWAKDALERNTEIVSTRGRFRAEHRFWTRLLGATMTASQIVSHLGLLEFNIDRIIDFAIDKAVSYRDDSMTTTAQGDNSPDALSRFLLEHVGDILIVPYSGKLPQRQVVARYDKPQRKLWISEREFRNWLLKNEMGSRETIGNLAMHGIVKKARVPYQLTKGTDLPSVTLTCIEIDASHPLVVGAVEQTDYVQSNVVEMRR